MNVIFPERMSPPSPDPNQRDPKKGGTVQRFYIGVLWNRLHLRNRVLFSSVFEFFQSLR